MSNLTYITGDILTPNKSDKRVVVCHQVNCRGVMGAGLARQVRQMHPYVYSLYRDKCHQIQSGNGGLGDVQFCSALERGGYVVANIFGQDGYGRDKQYTDYDALRKAFAHIVQTFPCDTIRIPYKMGCGLGGGEWTVVETIINETLVAAGFNVEIWKCPALIKRP